MAHNQGNYDNAANAPYWAVNSAICKAAPSEVHSAPTAANVAYLYGNTAPSAYITDETVGLFMVSAAEETAGSDNVVDVSIIQGGTQYAEVPAVSFSGGGGSGAAATASVSGGVVTGIAVTNVGSSYETVPAVAVAQPSISMVYTDVNTSTDVFTYSGGAHYFNDGDAVIPILGAGTRITMDVVTFANTAINTSTNIITIPSHPFVYGDYVTFSNGGGTTPTGITNGQSYMVQVLSDSTIALYDTYEHVIRQQTIPDGLGIVDFSTQGSGAAFTLTSTFTTDKPYYVITTGDNTFKLARSAELAAVPTAMNITGRGTGNDKGFINQTATAATAIADKGLGEQDGTNSSFTHTPHIGWNLKKVGTGGRAGRVQWETLSVVSTVNGDGSDNITLPNT
jgi:hypothetical protein